MFPALSFNKVSKTFKVRAKSVEALSDITFDIHEGEIFGLVGPNGAGKSTTIKIALGMLGGYTGDVRIYGNSAEDSNARRHVSYVPESPSLYEQFTPNELLKTALEIHKVDKASHARLRNLWLERLSLEAVASKRLRTLSKGTVQRVALAHALIVSPKLLVLDEPLSGLDPVGRKDVIQILRDYKQSGGSMLLTSHVLYDVEELADKFGFIQDGVLEIAKNPNSLLMDVAAPLFSVRYHSLENLTPDGVELRAGLYEMTVPQDELINFLGWLNERQGLLISIKPFVSLESAFLAKVRQA
ncbi:ABC transporter ATP-binding protein [Chitinolyticbacter albus]|uniref:ABC transporter ATP-binding protein n=1 Tax=Chitinolyticbacter albus TaxID=2961951 RepID=UPI00210AFBB7|nr:ABC transporter ATP-binding protein [Chitinolyticbacter albus]